MPYMPGDTSHKIQREKLEKKVRRLEKESSNFTCQSGSDKQDVSGFTFELVEKWNTYDIIKLPNCPNLGVVDHGTSSYECDAGMGYGHSGGVCKYAGFWGSESMR